MIPNKLYIPISSQNFNSIMSSESISPAVFYERRNFGMKRYVRVVANNLNDRIPLYSSFPKFTIPVTEEDNFPIYIEILTSAYDSELFYSAEIDGVYYCDSTIYLTPFTCKFFFLSKESYLTTYSRQKQSLYTKFVNLYSQCFFQIGNSTQLVEYNYCKLTNSGKDISLHIAYDRKVNKLKGFYIAYLIGKLKDLTPELVRAIHLTNQISDNLSSALASTNSWAQQQQLTELYAALNQTLRIISKEDEQIASALEDDSVKFGLPKDGLYSWLQGMGFLAQWKKLKNIQPPMFIPTPYANSDQDSKDQYINSVQQKIYLLRESHLPTDEELPSIANYRLSNIPDGAFLNFIFTEMLHEIYDTKSFLENRYEFSLSLCKQYKNYVGDEEFGEIKDYINALNKNLNAYEAFDINSTTDSELRSFAAFCQKAIPDDFQKLEDHLIKCEIGEVHKGLALAGLLFGYADMPKTFTQILTNGNHAKFVTKQYAHLEQQLGIIIAPEQYQEPLKIEEKDLSLHHQNTSLYSQIEPIIRPLNPTPKTIKKIEQAIAVENRQYNPEAFLQILNNLISSRTNLYKAYKKFFAQERIDFQSFDDFKNVVMKVYYDADKNSRTLENKQKIEIALDLEAHINDRVAFMAILDDHIRPDSKEYQAIARHFNFSGHILSQQKMPVRIMQQQSLFAGGGILEDDYWITECESMINLPKARKQFRKDAEWLFSEYNAGKHKNDSDRSPQRFIDHLKNLLFKMQRDSKRDFTINEIQTIINYLNNRYAL